MDFKVKLTKYNADERYFAKNKVYTVKNGRITSDTGYVYYGWDRDNGFKNIDDLNDWFIPWYTFELVDDDAIERVIFNDPATIILWHDGTKTVAKCLDGDKYDAEKGFCIAYLKKMIGAKQFSEELHKWVKEEDEPLTIEELEKMDGQRVWLSSLVKGEENFTDEYTGWYTVDVRARRLNDDNGGGYKFEPCVPENGYKAYRKPPKQAKQSEPVEEKPYKTKPPFNVGDKVKIINHRNWWWNIEGEMDKYMNKVLTISECNSESYAMKECPTWAWAVEDFVQD